MTIDDVSAAPTSLGARPIVVYDAGCGMCTRTIRFVRACDWLGRLDDLPFDEAAAQYPEIASRPLDEGMRVLHPDGRVDVAIIAVRTIMLCTPPGMLVGWLLYIPPLRWLGARAYARVAARRASATCAAPPA